PWPVDGARDGPRSHGATPLPSQPQPHLRVHAIKPMLAHIPAFPVHHHAQALPQHGQGVTPALVPEARATESRSSGRPPLAHLVAPHQVVHHLPLLDGLQNFFETTSCSMALSSDRSATSRFSFTFSSRS